MVTVNGQTDQNVTIAVDELLLSDHFADHLHACGYHLLRLDFDADVANLLSANAIDVILTAVHQPAMQALERISAQMRNQILLLLMPQDITVAIDETVISLVDAVLPLQSTYAIRQIRLLVDYHRRLQRQQRRIEELERLLETQQRVASEIEILKNAIVRNVSHELRTPLLQVKSAVSLIKEDLSDHRLITYAENATARLETHVTNITMLGHSLDINIGPLILRDAVQGARRNLARIWQRRSQTDRIILALDHNLPPVLADRQGLSMVLQLLMDNALKFSENPVEVIGRVEGEHVHVAVRDTGIGIAEDQLQAIFESFYQIDSSSTRRYGGAGVGLALVKLILDHHGIQIHVNSTVDEGSTFWFNLPYVSMDEMPD